MTLLQSGAPAAWGSRTPCTAGLRPSPERHLRDSCVLATAPHLSAVSGGAGPAAPCTPVVPASVWAPLTEQAKGCPGGRPLKRDLQTCTRGP